MVKKNMGHLKKTPLAAHKKDKPEKGKLSDDQNLNSANLEINIPAKSLSENTFPIVGIGASAGGLEAFSELLKNLPYDTGMAFILVQHLAPEQHSLLAELLLRTTKMPVEEITDKMKIHPNHVYVIQPGTNIALFNGTIHLMPRPESDHRPYTSIDFFLRSLAEDQRSKGIGVILSGTGSDGVDGLKAVKAEGGITFAQHPQSSKYNAMPKAAISAGVVDFILSPGDIARELTRLGKHPYVTQQPAIATDEEPEYTKDALRNILMLLRSNSGVDFSYYKKSTLMRRIDRRMVVYNKKTLDDYLDFLRQNPKEISLLFHDILITVTRFFRDPKAYKSLARNVYPAITQNKGAGERIRVWISGCSSGEEAYSIAISFLEFAEQLSSKPSLQIFATDINEMALEKARKGIYPESIESDVSQTRLNRFFTKVPDGYQINTAVRESCVFARHDIIKDPPLSNMDLISSRNLLIYLGSEVHNKVIPMFHYALKPNGFLLLGSSETVGRFDDLFKPVDSKQKIYAKKPLAARRGLPPDIAPSSLGTEQAAKDTKKAGKRLDDKETRESYDPLKQADDIILSKYSPPGVIIDEDMQILKFRGRTGVFLEPAPGRASLNLLNMARHGIELDLRILIQKAKETGLIARKQNIRIKYDNDIRSVTLEVVPLQSYTEQYNFLILFMEEPGSPEDKKTGLINIKEDKKDKTKSVDIENELLKKELDDTKEYLRSVIQEKESTNEELRAANEELQSSTEELQSINEELEAAKEELQSSNEELTTLNEELKIRNSELTRLSDDLKNILNSVNIPIIMLDSELRIRSITPLTEKLLNLTPSDIGQKITKLKLRFDIAGLKDIIQNSIDSLTLNEQEIQDSKGHWFSLRVRPYITMEKHIQGAVMSFIDIDDIKRSSQIIAEARDFSESIVETVREPLIVLDSNLQVIATNPAFYQTFQALPEESIGRHIYDIGNHQWDMPPLRNLIEKVLTSNNNFEDFVVEHEFPKIGHKIMLLNARKIERRTEGGAMLLLAIEDITERKRQENELLKAKELSDALNNINAAISSTLNFGSIIQKVVKQGAKAIGCDSAAVELIEDDLPSVKYIYNLKKDMLGKKLSVGQTFIDDEKTGKQPLIISDVSTNHSLDAKLMQQHNIRSLLAVPLMAKNQILGTLFFFYNSKIKNFDRLLIDFCEKLAVTVALSLESARLYETQSSIANILQETLLTVPPKIEGIETGSAYMSATKMSGAVGGDFYDVFRLENDQLAITIGDVAGKGIEAAKLTGLTKNTIRAYAKYDYSPASILTKTCEAICETMKPSSFITIFFGILNIDSGTLTYCSAGHPPAIVKRASLDVDMLETRSPALISLKDFKYINSQSQLDKGDILVLYTDGITEARRGHEFYGEERLLDFMTGTKIVSADELCSSLFDEVLSFTRGILSDDIAILTIQLKK